MALIIGDVIGVVGIGFFTVCFVIFFRSWRQSQRYFATQDTVSMHQLDDSFYTATAAVLCGAASLFLSILLVVITVNAHSV